jgi:hypothetical protein
MTDGRSWKARRYGPAVLDDTLRFDVAQALARWSSDTPETHEERVKQARAARM